MSFDDFATIFDYLDVVHVDLRAFSTDKNDLVWENRHFHGMWEKESTAGGNQF
jgi:hypothetical protein